MALFAGVMGLFNEDDAFLCGNFGICPVCETFPEFRHKRTVGAILWTPLEKWFLPPTLLSCAVSYAFWCYFTACNSYNSCSHRSLIQYFVVCMFSFFMLIRVQSYRALQIEPPTFDLFHYFVSHVRRTEIKLKWKKILCETNLKQIVLFQL